MSKRILSFVMCLFLIAGGATGASAQQRQVSGTVTGPDQRPIAGATVTITGTARGVQTDAAGR
ncbi:MAG TPA: carboxypeptidase-like regulatory domain-containing protein [Longimicrobium sp.]|nr:carboxypeptidase-like regulatory domain-containing protein [Longimicrobium sp.]